MSVGPVFSKSAGKGELLKAPVVHGKDMFLVCRRFISCQSISTLLMALAVGLTLVSWSVGQAQALLDKPVELQGVGIEEHLGAQLPLDLMFVDQGGVSVKLGDYFKDDKPVIFNMVYYSCPMLCNLVLNGVTASVKEMDWTPGKEFRMLAVSINPRKTFDLAEAKRASYLKDLGKTGGESGWSFTVGEESQSKRLAEALGYHYYWDEKQKEYAHTAATFVITPEGKVSRYLYGIEYDPKDLRLALLEASEGKLGSTLDRLILYCYHYDPLARGYVLFAGNVMKLGGAATVLLLGAFLGTMWRREQRQKKLSHLSVERL